MANHDPRQQLSRRERQIMDIIFRLGEATVTEVRDLLPDPPTTSAVRATLHLLERKGSVRHRTEGQKNVYLPAHSRDRVGRNALQHLVRTFFDGSRERAMAALVDSEELTAEEIDALAEIVEKARKEDSRG